MGRTAAREGRPGMLAGAGLAACLLAAACGLSACSSSKKSTPAGTTGAPAADATGVSATATVDPRTRPAAVPTTATQARAQLELGAGSGGDSAETLSSMSCAGGVLTIKTSQHVIYAELPCDRALPEGNVKPFVGKPIHVRSVPSAPAKLYLDSSGAGSVEFTVGRVWVASS